MRRLTMFPKPPTDTNIRRGEFAQPRHWARIISRRGLRDEQAEKEKERKKLLSSFHSIIYRSNECRRLARLPMRHCIRDDGDFNSRQLFGARLELRVDSAAVATAAAAKIIVLCK